MAEFQVHSSEVELDVTDSDTGRYQQTIHYVNRIDVAGSSSPGTGESVPPVTNKASTAKNGTAERQRDSRTDNGAP